MDRVVDPCISHSNRLNVTVKKAFQTACFIQPAQDRLSYLAIRSGCGHLWMHPFPRDHKYLRVLIPVLI